MARKRAIAPVKKTAMATPQSKQVASAGQTPTPRQSTRPTRGTATQRPVYTEPELSDDEDHQPVTTKKKAKPYMYHQPEQKIPLEGPPAPRYNTRYKQAQLSEQSQDADDVEEIPREDLYPLYKDDLPNAFNGAVDPSKDFFSKAPNEVIDNVLSYLVLDNDPDRGVKVKAGTYKPMLHVLLSMATMSRLFYHATEGFARRYWIKHKLGISDPARNWPHHPEEALARINIREEKEREKERNRRRSVRIAEIPKAETHEFYRKKLVFELRTHCAICLKSCWRPGKLANQVTVCEVCEWSVFGSIMNLTDALKRFDLRDYMLIKSRKPGPRAKFLDLPMISYGSDYKPVGFPAFKPVCIYYFRRTDVEMLAKLVHGDVEKHVRQKVYERAVRRIKARKTRVREFRIKHHQEKVEVSTGAVAKRHAKGLKKLLDAGPDDDEDDYLDSDCGCGFCPYNCCDDHGLCDECGDVPGYSHEVCDMCANLWVDRRMERYYNRSA